MTTIKNPLWREFVLLLSMVLLGSGCGTTSNEETIDSLLIEMSDSREALPDVFEHPAAVGQSLPSAVSAKYAASIEPRIRTGLYLKILVTTFGQEEVSVPSRRVNSAGLISLPILGDVDTAEKTLNEFSRLLTALYSEYLRNPIVTVEFVLDSSDLATSPWGYVTVLGQVNDPGRVNFPPSGQMTVSIAIQNAGGFDLSAKKKAIVVTRTIGEERANIKVNLKSLGKDGESENDIDVLPGDQIYIPELFF